MYPPDDVLTSLRATIERALPTYLDELRELTSIDCGSYTKAGVDRVGAWVAERFRGLGADVRVHRHDTLGDTVVGTWRGSSVHGPRLLLIGHMDTVFDEGTAVARPFRIEDGIAYGPGVTDMKGGLLAGIHAIEALRPLADVEAAGLPFARLTYVANPDEEIGSPSSTPIIRELAADVDVCLVLECARANGDIVSSRKGIIDARLTVHGRAAHAGVEPEKGRSAILAAAHVVTALHELNGRWPGVTVNVGVIDGGTRPNVVADTTTLEVDVRAVRAADLSAVELAVGELIATPAVPDVTIEMETMARWEPMEKLEGSGRLAKIAVGLAERLGFTTHDVATGGASDANTTSGMGIPTLDGLGPIGGRDHSPDEYLEVDSVVPRTTLLAALLLAIGRDPVIAAWSGG
jgi:glutamate carboxypeptidase